jgi:hypothetical protein
LLSDRRKGDDINNQVAQHERSIEKSLAEMRRRTCERIPTMLRLLNRLIVLAAVALFCSAVIYVPFTRSSDFDTTKWIGEDLWSACGAEAAAGQGDKIANMKLAQCVNYLETMLENEQIPYILCIEPSLIRSVIIGYGNRIIISWLGRHTEYLKAPAKTVVILSFKDLCNTLPKPKSDVY